MLLGVPSAVMDGYLQEQLYSLKLLGSKSREGITCFVFFFIMESHTFLSPDENHHFQFFHLVCVLACLSSFSTEVLEGAYGTRLYFLFPLPLLHPKLALKGEWILSQLPSANQGPLFILG